MTRAQIWQMIGNAVEAGMPAAKGIQLFDDTETAARYGPWLELSCTTLADAQRWAAWMGVTTDFTVPMGDTAIHFFEGRRNGWQWHIKACVPAELPAGVDGVHIGHEVGRHG